MLDFINPNGEVEDAEIGPNYIIGPIKSLDTSSVTDFTTNTTISALRSIVTNYDYTQYDADAAKRVEIYADDEEDSDSLFDDEGFGIHKSKPIVDGGMIVEDATAQKLQKSTALKGNDMLFNWDTAKGGINGLGEDKLSRELSPKPSSYMDETETPIVTNVGRKFSFVGTPFVPLASSHNDPNKQRSNQILKDGLIQDEGSASTAKLTEDGTTEGDVNSIRITRVPGDAVNDHATQEIFEENVVKYKCFFSEASHSSSGGSEDVLFNDGSSGSVVMIPYTPVDEPMGNEEIISVRDVAMQQKVDKEVTLQQKLGKFDKGLKVHRKKEKEPRGSGLASIKNFDTNMLSFDFYERGLSDDEDSSSGGSARSYDSVDSIIRKQALKCDPCDIGGLMEDISGAVCDIAIMLGLKKSKRQHSDENTKSDTSERSEFCG